jgi:hypothetical protein
MISWRARAFAADIYSFFVKMTHSFCHKIVFIHSVGESENILMFMQLLQVNSIDLWILFENYLMFIIMKATIFPFFRAS